MGCVAQICNRFEISKSLSINEIQILTLDFKKELYQPKKIETSYNITSLILAEDESLDNLIQECETLEKQLITNNKCSTQQPDSSKQEKLIIVSTQSIPSSAFINLENYHKKGCKDELTHNTLSKDGTPISVLRKKRDQILSPISIKKNSNKQKKKVRFNKCYIRIIRVSNDEQ